MSLPETQDRIADRKILLAVTGGIAAYKSAELCRQLIKLGASVRVVMTAGAKEFVSPLTFQALSGHPVHSELLDPDAEAGMGHIELAKWPDLIVIAPATANLIASYRAGLANDLLSTLLLATQAPVALVPAMNQAMWLHPATQSNLSSLEELMGDRLKVCGPQSGEQACGDIGPGRMLEPEAICEQIASWHVLDAFIAKDLQGLRVVITAGPTREALDPVRYISNHSSGKMGYALAEACRIRGASVVLVSGPVDLDCPAGVQRVSVSSALDMLAQVEEQLAKGCDLFIAAAAVADYRPADVADQKIKKTGDAGEMRIVLTQNPDIVASVAAKANKPFVVGFAAETENVEVYARAKLKKKNLDMIVANDVSVAGIGFNSDDNAVQIIWGSGDRTIARQSKTTLANEIVTEIACQLQKESK